MTPPLNVFDEFKSEVVCAPANTNESPVCPAASLMTPRNVTPPVSLFVIVLTPKGPPGAPGTLPPSVTGPVNVMASVLPKVTEALVIVTGLGSVTAVAACNVPPNNDNVPVLNALLFTAPARPIVTTPL